jgi:hydrogenase maturation protein HypF
MQGVGFRSFVQRLARELDLTGWVLNSAQGVFIEVEGAGAPLRHFLVRIEREKPPRAIIQSLEFSFLDAVGYEGFTVRASEEHGAKTGLILPDIATCPDCLREIFQPDNRRHRYPFTNCANCGPRFTIIEELPYDRPNTAMKKFTMCPRCEREYRDPADRRFHAQLNACPRRRSGAARSWRSRALAASNSSPTRATSRRSSGCASASAARKSRSP